MHGTISTGSPKELRSSLFGRRSCTKNIVFLKTHKTGGSTVQVRSVDVFKFW